MDEGAAVVGLPVVPSARAAARNLMRSARSSDPVLVAESIGLRVYRCSAPDALWADGAQRGPCLLISEAVPASSLSLVTARLLAGALVRLWGLQVDVTEFSRVFADEFTAADAA